MKKFADNPWIFMCTLRKSAHNPCTVVVNTISGQLGRKYLASTYTVMQEMLNQKESKYKAVRLRVSLLLPVKQV